ncbi:GAF domain-containing sensor histidine kinase [Algoriphagus sp.]|uniref:GAF domain-containing sensor histidine kinase n=1 Tax=Algoriphagus sp. TaxID=1872435 RepID=UPI00391BAC74
MDQENSILPVSVDLDPPIPSNEMERIMALVDFDLDYMDLNKSFADLTKLAAKVAGTSISLINLIDSFTQWSVSSYGIDIRQMPREESVCQYTIMEENSDGFEVEDLSKDERFKDRPFVTNAPHLKYYFGIPLKVNDDLALGALCVLHDDYKSLSAEKKEMLEIIAGEVVNRIKIHQAVANLKRTVQETNSIKNRVAHDIRGPIGGIIGLAEIIQMQGDSNKLEEVLDFIALIQKSGKSVLELADEILSHNFDLTGGVMKRAPKDHEFTLSTLKFKLEDMFNPQAITKQVKLELTATAPFAEIPFPKNKILQILGNLISNSIKFTPSGGIVEVLLDMEVLDQQKILQFKVRDSGVGISPEKIAEILRGGTTSSKGTSGEKGYGFGLNLVNHLIKGLKGRLLIKSDPGEGTEFEFILPLA